VSLKKCKIDDDKQLATHPVCMLVMTANGGMFQGCFNTQSPQLIDCAEDCIEKTHPHGKFVDCCCTSNGCNDRMIL
ncbi:hypothetical protein PFISCL1PPCAC_24598, partial [Pristionchus fissidentatus]